MTVRSDFSENSKAITVCKSREEVGILYLYSVGRFTACCVINFLTEKGISRRSKKRVRC